MYFCVVNQKLDHWISKMMDQKLCPETFQTYTLNFDNSPTENVQSLTPTAYQLSHPHACFLELVLLFLFIIHHFETETNFDYLQI